MRIFIIHLFLLVISVFSEEANTCNSVLPFSAKVYKVDVINTGYDPFAVVTYQWTDFLANKKNGTIICGHDANWLVSTVIETPLGNNNPLSIGDSLNFVVHSPSKLSIDSDSLPKRYDFELHIDFEDVDLVSFNLRPKDFSSDIEDDSETDSN